MKRYLFFPLILLFLAGVAHAKTMVWKITSPDGQVAYIAGATHLLKAEDYPPPKPFEKAYQKAEKLVLEANLYEMSENEFQMQTLTLGVYRDGRTLKGVLDPEIYSQLQAYAASFGLSLEAMGNMKISMVVATVSLAQSLNLGLPSAGMDVYFLDKALADGKEVIALETFTEQIRYVTTLGENHENEWVLQVLSELQFLKSNLETLRDAWLKGKVDYLTEHVIQTMESNSPNMYEQLIVKRNEYLLTALMPLLNNDDIEFILLNINQLLGDAGILQTLYSQGFKIKQM